MSVAQRPRRQEKGWPGRDRNVPNAIRLLGLGKDLRFDSELRPKLVQRVKLDGEATFFSFPKMPPSE